MNARADGARLGSLFGFPIYAHPAVISLAVVLLVSPLVSSRSSSELLERVVIALFLYASLVAHELGHALAARHFGVPVRQITLTWYGGYAEFYMRPATRRSEIMIALAGPLTNLAIGAIAFVMLASMSYHLFLPDARYHYVPDTPLVFTAHVTRWIAFANLGLGAFNLLPGLPLDGGHILRSLLNFRMSRGRASWIAAWAGFFIAIATIVGGWFAQSLWTIVIGISLAITAWRYRRRLAYE